MGIRMILLEVVGMAIVNHRPLGRRVLNRRRRIGILDGVEHGIKKMRSDHDSAGSNLGHGLFRGILALDLVPLGLLWFCPVSHQDAIAEPFSLRPFQGG